MEQWRPIAGYESLYAVSDRGQIWSYRRGRTLAPRLNSSGYAQVQLCRGGGKRAWYIHRLVLAAFVGPCPPGKEGDHRNAVRTDNRLSNLRYLTHAQNMRHMSDRRAFRSRPSVAAVVAARERFLATL